MSAPEGNSEFCFPESLNVSRDEVEGNIESRETYSFRQSKHRHHINMPIWYIRTRYWTTDYTECKNF